MPDPAPTGAAPPIVHCLSLMEALETRTLPPNEAAAWGATFLRTWFTLALSGAPVAMETVAGFGRPRRPNIARVLWRHKRDEAIRQYAREHLPDKSPYAAACLMAEIKPPPVEGQPGSRKQLFNILALQ